MIVDVFIDSRILIVGLKPAVKNKLKREFTHVNPEYYKTKNLGYSTWNVSSQIKTFVVEEDKQISFPRGGLQRILNLFEEELIEPQIHYKQVESEDLGFPKFRPLGRDDTELYYYQKDAIAACHVHLQGCVRTPTGSGKTAIGLGFIATRGQRALILVRSAKIQDQWERSALKELGLDKNEVSVIRSGRKHKVGAKITIALQQSMYAKKSTKLDELLKEDFGTLIIDEVQETAANTFLKVVNKIPAKARIGLSADERRKDGREFLIYDMFGPPIYEISRKKLEKEGKVRPVIVRAVETNFEADWYRDADGAEKNWNDLLDAMELDHERNDVIIHTVEELLHLEQIPIFIFTHRREYAENLVKTIGQELKINVGLLLGGSISSDRFDRDKKRLETGEISVVVGTYKAIGTGIDIPAVSAGICATPIGDNPLFFNQIRGRLCRKTEGKSVAYLYYILDERVFSQHLKKMSAWNDNRVEIKRSGNWIKRA